MGGPDFVYMKRFDPRSILQFVWRNAIVDVGRDGLHNLQSYGSYENWEGLLRAGR